ncbi:MAG TPA: glycosyltransferase family 1 protein [Bacteroidia bacterium]|nr:glycosyltransferase family 1 protein [Bacteroidia bacterium]
MPHPRLHIVSFDVPFPPSYGGVIDVFYKIKALHALGVKITLHCFHYGREKSSELEKYCEKVYYYSRRTSVFQLCSSEPFIVNSRKSEEMLNALAADDAPILFEGLHCSAYVAHPALKAKKKIVRTHNIEHDYYRALARVEKKWSKRQYFKREAGKLEKFEAVLNHAQHVLAISPADAADLSSRYKNVQHVMAFHANEEVKSKPGIGDFAFYHGNLEVGENNQAALFLVNEVFRSLDYRLVIGGNNPSAELRNAAAGMKNVTLKANINTTEIDELIANAQVNVLPTFQATGIKLKLLVALFNGRHCLVNAPMVANTGLESLCIIREDAASMRAEIQRLATEPFTAEEIDKRRVALAERFSNKLNAEKILKLIV